MWFFDLIIIAILFVIGYGVINRRLVNNTGLKDLVRKYGEEINNVTVAFNKTAVENVSMLDLKIQEARETMRLLGKKAEEYGRILAECGEERKRLESLQKETAKTGIQSQILGKLDRMVAEDRNGTGEAPTGRPSREKKAKESPTKDKQTIVLAYIGEGRSVQEIADKLDISQEEVRYYIKKEDPV